MKRQATEVSIPMQVGSELRLTKAGEIVIDNPEIELAKNRKAADAVFVHRFDPSTGEHILRLLDPVADHQHRRTSRG